MPIKILNLYAGIGGNRALWPDDVEVTAVEYTPRIAQIYQENHPNDTVVVGDAHEYLLEHHEEFDFVWSSPPCQSHSKMVKATRYKSQQKRYPDMGLYAEIIFLEHFFNGSYVVENVVPYYGAMRSPQRIGRHLFWTDLDLTGIEDVKRPKDFINLATVAGSQQMKEWLGISYEGNVYYDGNHCPAQVLRNAVHPDLGLAIYNKFTQARGYEDAK